VIGQREVCRERSEVCFGLEQGLVMVNQSGEEEEDPQSAFYVFVCLLIIKRMIDVSGVNKR
jgi:hypothetical protein